MKFRLNTAHYIEDRFLDEGSVVGDGTNYPLPEGYVPSAAMTPLDDDAKSAYEERHGEAAQDARAADVNFRPLSLSGMELHPSFNDGVERQGEPKRRDRPEEDSGGRVSPTYASQLALLDVQDSRIAADQGFNLGEELENIELDPKAPEPKGAQRAPKNDPEPNKNQSPTDQVEGQSATDPGGEAAPTPTGTRKSSLLSSKAK